MPLFMKAVQSSKTTYDEVVPDEDYSNASQLACKTFVFTSQVGWLYPISWSSWRQYDATHVARLAK
eukprot:scaffold219426_cov47-Prasinocladus_malaysianus.AAC.2